MSIELEQRKCCEHFDAEFTSIEDTQMVAISEGIYEGVVPVEGVRYPSPNHMSGWWHTTDDYDGNIDSIKTVHFSHIIEKRPELAIYMGLPNGYRFLLGNKEESVWFDEKVANESV